MILSLLARLGHSQKSEEQISVDDYVEPAPTPPQRKNHFHLIHMLLLRFCPIQKLSRSWSSERIIRRSYMRRPHAAGGPISAYMTSHSTITTGGRAIYPNGFKLG
ncbi:hypothetical protein M378DRAFT_166322 [Amanita muscaria Koide BX008]|uniref:Uncharacterized protein n=1 Tax=Amanita muscaria (strain Koide BX008) TaxID=946122 RepID=A0A0C2T603_AMAMK|nr:hypothetical protein M378DRAFT_166322 [Amanita muscaria Koide BX008]